MGKQYLQRTKRIPVEVDTFSTPRMEGLDMFERNTNTTQVDRIKTRKERTH